MLRRLALLLLLAGAAAAGEVRIAEVDQLLRPGLLFRCTVLYVGPLAGPCQVQAALLQGDRVLSRVELTLPDTAALGGAGARLVLPPPAAPRPGPAPRLAVTVSGGGAGGSAERAVGTVDGARQELDGHYAWLRASGSTDPLPWLWIEQGAGLASAASTLGSLRALEEVNARLAAWRAGGRPRPAPGASLRALRDPVDRSVQPYRLHLPAAAATAVALLLADGTPTPAKERWPEASPALVAAMTAAGIAVVEAYPAGDGAWEGVGPRRALLALADAVAGGLDGARPLLVGVGGGATGAVALAEDDPGRWGALLLDGPRLTAQARRPANLSTLALAITGPAAPAVERWLATVGAAGGVPDRTLGGAAEPGTWRRLLAARAAPLPASTPRVLVRRTPGPAGPVLVEELARWGEPAEVRWQDEPPRITTSGVARLGLVAPRPGITVDGRPWRAPAAAERPRKAWGQACGPLAGYADGPFVLVTGSGESEAAAAACADLSQRFLAAWVAHAQGAPPRLADRDFRARDWSGHHLVLIGNARSNLALRALVADGLRLPLAWDARSVQGRGVGCLRAEGRAVALCWPHPANDGRLLVVLDGAPAWSAGGLPLAGLPDLSIGPAAPGGVPLLSVEFPCDWR